MTSGLQRRHADCRGPENGQDLIRRHLSNLKAVVSAPAVASAPFPQTLNRNALFKARGDISAGEIKIFKDILTVKAEVHLLVDEKEAEEVYNLTEGDSVEVGPFMVRPCPRLSSLYSCKLTSGKVQAIFRGRYIVQSSNPTARNLSVGMYVGIVSCKSESS